MEAVPPPAAIQRACRLACRLPATFRRVTACAMQRLLGNSAKRPLHATTLVSTPHQSWVGGSFKGDGFDTAVAGGFVPNLIA